MPVQLTCPSCQATLRLDEKYLGKKIQCGHCKQTFTATAPKPAQEPLAAEIVDAPLTAEIVEEPDPATAIQTNKKQPAPPSPKSDGKAPAKNGGKAPPPAQSKKPPKSDTKGKPTRKPERKQASGWSVVQLVVLLLGLGAIGIALLGCVIGVGWLMVRSPEPKPIAQNKDVKPNDDKKPIDLDKDKVKDLFEEIKLDKIDDPKLDALKDFKRDDGPKDFRRDDGPKDFKFDGPKDFKRDDSPKEFKDPFRDRKFKDPDPKPAPGDVPVFAKFPAHDANALALKACKLEDEKVTRMLPGTMDDVAVGGGGRFILFHLPALRKIGMLDVTDGKIVHYFPTAGDNVKFSAGLTKLVIAFPETRVIQRWDLISKQKELTVGLPDIGAARMVLLGSASQGPVLVVGSGDHPSFRAGKSVFLNLATFKEVTFARDNNGRHGFPAGYTRVSAEGTVFGCWEPDVSPQGQQSYIITGNQLKGHYEHNSVGHIVPGPDGKILYTASGMYTNENRPIGGAAENRQFWVVPSVQGNFYLSSANGIRLPGKKGKGKAQPPGGEANTLSIHIAGDSRPLLQGIEFVGADRFARDVFGNDKRVLFVPDAELLVTIPPTNDRFELRRINIEDMLNKSGIDYLYVMSRAPDAVQRGTDYQYRLTVKSKQGGLKYKLDAGPAGMKVSTDGIVVWKVGADHDLVEETVLLTVSDKAGQEVFHTFKLRVVADPLPNVGVNDPKIDAPKQGPVSVAALKGKWQTVEGMMDGKPLAPASRDKARWLIGDDTITVLEAGPKGEVSRTIWNYKLDGSKSPAHLELTTQAVKNFTIHGILKLEGDRMTVCIQYNPGRDRPTAFDASAGSKQSLTVYVRMQDQVKVEPKDPGKDIEPPKDKPAIFADIRPVKLDAQRVERMLPDTISDINIGGGGRFLLVTLPNQRKVALFDANEAKIVHYFPLANDNVRVAAGKEHMILAFPDTGILQRWNLLTKEKELTVASPFNETIKSITMGFNSHGPVFVAFKDRDFRNGTPQFIDLKFKTLDIAIDGRMGGDPAFPHASADGTLIGYRDGVGGEGHTVTLLNVGAKSAKASNIWCSTSILAGSPDSRFVYTGTGVYNADMKIVHPQTEPKQSAKPFLPSLHGPYFMRLDYKDWDQHGGSIALFFQGNFTPFATLDNIDGVTNEQIAYGSNRDKLTHSKRIFLIPGANLLVSVPKTNDRLVLHQVDMNALLEKSPIDYLLIASQPPTRIAQGDKLQYKIDVRAKKGGVKYTLDAGPKGMAVSPQGDLTWTVPADSQLGDETIIVTVRDAAGQEIFHTFRLSVVEAAGKN